MLWRRKTTQAPSLGEPARREAGWPSLWRALWPVADRSKPRTSIPTAALLPKHHQVPRTLRFQMPLSCILLLLKKKEKKKTTIKDSKNPNKQWRKVSALSWAWEMFPVLPSSSGPRTAGLHQVRPLSPAHTRPLTWGAESRWPGRPRRPARRRRGTGNPGCRRCRRSSRTASPGVGWGGEADTLKETLRAAPDRGRQHVCERSATLISSSI